MKQNFSDSSARLIGQKMFQILDQAKKLESEGKDIIHFEIGDPDFDTPKHIKDAAIKSINDGETHYTSSFGLMELRELACQVTLKSRGFKPKLDQILVTPWSKFSNLSCSCLYLKLWG